MKAIVITTLKSATYNTHAGKAKPVYLISFADKLDDEQKACVREHGVFSANGHYYIGVKNPNVAWVQKLVKKQAKPAKKAAKQPSDYSKLTKAELLQVIAALTE